MFINGTLARVGKRPARKNQPVLKLAKYLAASTLPTPPAEVSWITKLAAAGSLPMYGNDTLGDCVEAAAGHIQQQVNFYAGHPKQPTEAQVIAAYSAVGGYVPGDPNTDNGTDMLSFLNWWKSTGIAGDKITGFASVNWTNPIEVRTAIQLFGSVYLGIQLPVSAQGQTDWVVASGGTTSASGQPGSWGGHCIPMVASSPMSHTVITWGTTLKMSHNFLLDYADEAYVVLHPEWIETSGLSASGFALSALLADLSLLPGPPPVSK